MSEETRAEEAKLLLDPTWESFVVYGYIEENETCVRLERDEGITPQFFTIFGYRDDDEEPSLALANFPEEGPSPAPQEMERYHQEALAFARKYANGRPVVDGWSAGS